MIRCILFSRWLRASLQKQQSAGYFNPSKPIIPFDPTRVRTISSYSKTPIIAYSRSSIAILDEKLITKSFHVLLVQQPRSFSFCLEFILMRHVPNYDWIEFLLVLFQWTVRARLHRPFVHLCLLYNWDNV